MKLIVMMWVGMIFGAVFMPILVPWVVNLRVWDRFFDKEDYKCVGRKPKSYGG